MMPPTLATAGAHRRSSASRAAALVAALCVGATTLAIAPGGALAVSSDVVIAEVYGGGGNSGATFTNDFVELRNLGAAPVDLTGWSVQYASASGTTWQTTPLSGTIAPGASFLVQEAQGAGGTTPLPTPDATGTIAMSGTSGKVALVTSPTALTCGIDCDAAPGVRDFVGYGSANDFEGAPAPALSNTTSASRGTADTDVNAADFTAGPPSPVGSGGTGPTDPCSSTPTAPACVPGYYSIQDVQGDGFRSPIVGQSLRGLEGVVTAVSSTGGGRGFWIEDPAADPARPSASSGLFVFTGASVPPEAVVGNLVSVSGSVIEFVPGGAPSSLSVTEISPTDVDLVRANESLPAPTVLGPGVVPDVYAPTPVGTRDIETISPVDPTASAIEFYEAHEGMRVQIDEARVIGPTNDFGEMFVTSKPDEQRTPRGGAYLPDYADVPTGRLLLTAVGFDLPDANVGDVLAGATVGPLGWSQFGGYELQATVAGTRVDGGLVATVADPAAADQLAVATYNVENLSPRDADDKFDRLAAGIVTNLASPDIVALEEVQDDDGPASGAGVVSAEQTLGLLVAAIVDAGGPQYEWAQIDPVDGADGGQPGGNIRVAFLYDPTRVTLVERAGGDSTTAVTVSTGADRTAELSASPGRVEPQDPAWTNSRKPLAAEFVFQGKKVIVVANHFNSKGGDQSADGRFQPPDRVSEVQRTQQAEVLNGFVRDVLDADPYANVVLAGDFNDYQFSGPIRTLTEDGALLTDLIATLPVDERYTYVFNGVSQVLDHIFVTKAITDVEYEVVHTNAEFFDQVSDHDPQVARIRPTAPPALRGTITLHPTSVAAGGSVTVQLAGWDAAAPLDVAFDGTTLTTVTTDGTGAATTTIVVPAGTAAGAHTVSATAADGTTTSAPLTVTAAPSSRVGRVLTNPLVWAGRATPVVLVGWSPSTEVRLSLDGSHALRTVRTDRSGRAIVAVRIPWRTSFGFHRIVATNPDGGSASSTIFVLRRR